jgi:SAM-dependent methyltransferase
MIAVRSSDRVFGGFYMNEADVKAFWEAHPCGGDQVKGLSGDYDDFFTRYDAFRYRQEAHILKCLDRINFRDRRTLEIGLGQGSDAEQIIRRGARWSGVDLTRESIERVAMRLALRRLPYERLEQASALALPFEDGAFDIVFSHGVLHHIPEIARAQAEIRRVLKPDGLLLMMVYSKWSLNYLVSIGIVRRLGLLTMYALGMRARGMVADHLDNAREVGLWRYLRMHNFIHRNTDGPHSPYSKVYSLGLIASDFREFEIVGWHREFMHAPPLSVGWLPLASVLGWHLWVELKPRPRRGKESAGRPKTPAAV